MNPNVSTRIAFKETWSIVQTWCDIPNIWNINQSSSMNSYWRRCMHSYTIDKPRKKVF